MQRAGKAIYIFLLLLLIYTLLRIIFYLLYFREAGMSQAELTAAFYWGCRMDASAIFYSNLVFFIYYFFLQDWFFTRQQKKISVLLFAVINIPLLAINCIDLAYYRFNLRRSNIDLFAVLPGALHALGAFWKSWWWLFLLFIAISVISLLLLNRTLEAKKTNRPAGLGARLVPGLLFLLVTGLLARGLAGRPIIPSTPLLYLPARYQPLAGNSTITVLYSLFKRQTQLKEKTYFSAAQQDSLFTARRQLQPTRPFVKMNVVVFILESFAWEYMEKTGAGQAKTPFLDSIMGESIVCRNAYSNGLESNKGLVAALAGIPPFFDEPFYYSAYSNNNIRGIGALLKEKGYHTSFFMGAGYDHFGFARFARMLGIDQYYSMKDYGNDQHYDGNWGIYDHYFLPYAARQLAKTPTPFFTTLFTLSTHFPFTLPDTLKKQFTLPGQGVGQNSMTYLDYSLRLFFNEIKNEPWYHNTLFVFSADHNIFWHTEEKATLYKRFRIPIFFHLPAERQQVIIGKPVQQLDIVPSVLDLLHYDRPFMSFGRSVFDTLSPGIAVNHIDDIYQAIDSSYLCGYNEKTEQPAYLYDFRADPALQHDLLLNKGAAGQHAIDITGHLKAVIQCFNHSMIKDQLYIK